MLETEFNMWTVYDHPRDYPQSFVARKQKISAGVVEHTNEVLEADSLEELRKNFMERGLWRIPPHVTDDPVIVECWI